MYLSIKGVKVVIEIAANVIAVPGPDNPKRQYLNIVAQHDRVIVRPGRDGHRLPLIWPYWLRQIISDRRPKQAICETRIANKFVYISSPQGVGQALYVARQAASQIYEVEELLLKRSENYGDGGRARAAWLVPGNMGNADEWLVRSLREEAWRTLALVRMPAGCFTNCGDGWIRNSHSEYALAVFVYLRIPKPKKQAMPLRELYKIFEARYLQASLARRQLQPVPVG